MTLEDIKQNAFNNTFPDENMTVEETAFYNAMWRTYRLYQQGALTKDLAEAMTTQARQLYDDVKFIRDQSAKDFQRVAELFKNVELAATKFTKEPSVEHGYDVLAAIYGENMVKREAIA